MIRRLFIDCCDLAHAPRAGEIAPMLCSELSWYEVDKSRCACERERSRNVRICLS